MARRKPGRPKGSKTKRRRKTTKRKKTTKRRKRRS